MDQTELKHRTKQFALRIMKLIGALPGTVVGKVVGVQLVRAGTSVGANYRAACRARSSAEFISKLGTVEEEADECGYWLELIVDGELMPQSKIKSLMQEASELTAIMTASIRTARRNGK